MHDEKREKYKKIGLARSEAIVNADNAEKALDLALAFLKDPKTHEIGLQSIAALFTGIRSGYLTAIEELYKALTETIAAHELLVEAGINPQLVEEKRKLIDAQVLEAMF